MRIFDAARQDILDVARRVRQSPTLTAIVALTLALGLRANAAIFSLVDRLFLRPPPGVRAPHEIRRISQCYSVPGTHVSRVRTEYSYALPACRSIRMNPVEALRAD